MNQPQQPPRPLPPQQPGIPQQPRPVQAIPAQPRPAAPHQPHASQHGGGGAKVAGMPVQDPRFALTLGEGGMKRLFVGLPGCFSPSKKLCKLLLHCKTREAALNLTQRINI